MTDNETKKALAFIVEAYPHFMDGRNVQNTLSLWAKMFNEPYAIVESAIIAFIASDTKGFPPNIGQIKEKIAQMNDTEPDEMQAWALVYRAAARGSREEYEKLPALVRGCIGDYRTFWDWGQEDTDTLNTVTKAGFLRTYRARAQKQREYGKLPDFAKASFPALEAKEPYRLPPKCRTDEPYDEPTKVPDNVLQQVSLLRGVADMEELKHAQDITRRLDGLNVAIDSLKGGSNADKQ